ncbi:MAG: ABC transporter ATP-binding protein [Deltaproteobacteria bacterium]|nr:ABC transporter ATP-binding protein [Deltaproteobacteria bacterium]
MSDPFLRVSNVETLYDHIQALRGISLEVPEGRIVAVLGANGAGKSTILKTIAGLIDDQPDKGTITFQGKRIDNLDAARIVRRGISYVPEGREVFPELSVMENLTMGAYFRSDGRAIRQDLDRVLALFPVMAERRSQQAGTMSGGEQQMLAIGRGLMARPSLLMLDEPSLGLAPILVKEIFRIVKTINEEGTTILLVEQNARMALQVAHHGYVMESGRMVMDDTCENLVKNEDIQEFYLGIAAETGVREQKRYRRKKRWR